MIGDTQKHLPIRGKKRRHDSVSSQAVIEATTTRRAADGDHERINELFGFENAAHTLYIASYYGFKEVVDAAIGKGVEINKPIYGMHSILWAVNGGHADMVNHLLQQGVKISDFEVHPLQEDEFVTKYSKNPFSAAWAQQRYDIFLLLLDATLTHKCREEGWQYSELLPQLHENDPRERLAERLAIWLKSTCWVPVDPDDSYAGPNMVIWRTLELVFGMGMYLRGESIIVRHLIEKKAPIPEPVLNSKTKWPEPNSVLMIDNASFHQSPPDSNPTEEFFAELKSFIRRHWHEDEHFIQIDFASYLEWCCLHIAKPSLNVAHPTLSNALLDSLIDKELSILFEMNLLDLETAGIHLAPAVHFGLMASGNSVMESGEDRDRIAAQEGVIEFEMEGAGVWDSFPCIVIKGACDYADSHKDKGWQRYAAATAAACTKAFLDFWVSSADQDLSGLASNFQNSLSLQNRDSSYQNRSIRAVDETQTQPAFLVPFLKNDLFVGRDDVLTELQGLLFNRGCRKVALVGLGGIGKTQIALQLAYWIKEKKQDYSVIWVPALSHASFEQACMQIMDACGIPTTDDSSVVDTVRKYLSSKRVGKWFLVVDSADDMQTVMGSKVAISVARRNIVEVPAMSRDEARSYFKGALIQGMPSADDEVMDHLLRLLEYLPLAITQAAAYLNVNQISTTEYLQLFKNTDRDRIELLSAEFQDDTRYEQSQDPMAAAWFISFNQIRRSEELAARILMFLAYVEPKAVPQSMLPEGESQQQMYAVIDF
ncbi:hypothetical protein F25303_11630 [Fusarium sp. NRRL 25303]|nr:hypothetical protein F25303_11630 [Fusarium sp. NRRL 25303]